MTWPTDIVKLHNANRLELFCQYVLLWWIMNMISNLFLIFTRRTICFMPDFLLQQKRYPIIQKRIKLKPWKNASLQETWFWGLWGLWTGKIASSLQSYWDSSRLKIMVIHAILFRPWQGKVQIKMNRCYSWFASIIFTYDKNSFSHDEA